MLRALASAVTAAIPEALILAVVVGAVVLIAREGRGAGGVALEAGDVATAVLASEEPFCSRLAQPPLEPPLIEIPTGSDARRIYRTPDIEWRAPRGKPAWTGEWL